MGPAPSDSMRRTKKAASNPVRGDVFRWARFPDVGWVGRAWLCRRCVWAFGFRILQLRPTRLEHGSPKFGLPPMASWVPIVAL